MNTADFIISYAPRLAKDSYEARQKLAEMNPYELDWMKVLSLAKVAARGYRTSQPLQDLSLVWPQVIRVNQTPTKENQESLYAGLALRAANHYIATCEAPSDYIEHQFLWDITDVANRSKEDAIRDIAEGLSWYILEENIDDISDLLPQAKLLAEKPGIVLPDTDPLTMFALLNDARYGDTYNANALFTCLAETIIRAKRIGERD